MELRSSMTHSQGLSINPYPEPNSIPRINAYFINIYPRIVLPSCSFIVKIMKELLTSSILAIFKE